MPVGDLAVRLRADTAEFESDMGRASHVANREMEAMVAKASAAGVLIGNALTAIAGHFSKVVGETIKLGDELSKLSQRTGQTVENLSVLRDAAKLSDVGFGELSTGLGFFNKALAEAQDENSKTGQTFKALGVDIASGPTKAFEQFTKAVDSLPNPEQKTAAMRVAFGRAGDALIPMIGSLDEVRQRLERLGVVMSDDLAKKSERFNDTLTLIGIAGRSAGESILSKLIEPLTTLAESFLKSKERGTEFKDSVIELGKIIVATNGQIGSLIPVWGTYIEQAAQKAFNALERLKQGTPKTDPFEVDGTYASTRPFAATNPEAVACAVSGGKWDGQRCVRAGDGKGRGRTPHDPSLTAEQIARDQARQEDEDAKTMSEAFSFLPKLQEAERERQYFENKYGEARLMGMSTEEVKAWERAMFDAIDAGTEAEERSARAAAGFTEDGKAIIENTKKANTFAHDLGLTFTSAFENAISHGNKLRDVLKGLGQDLLKLATRKLITEPLGNAFTDALKNATSGDGFSLSSLLRGGGGLMSLLGGGGSAGIGYGAAGSAAVDAVVSTGAGFVPALASGTPYVTRTGLAMIHEGERVVPAAQNRGGWGGGITIVNNNDFSGVDPQSVARVEAKLDAYRRTTYEAVRDAQRRRV